MSNKRDEQREESVDFTEQEGSEALEETPEPPDAEAAGSESPGGESNEQAAAQDPLAAAQAQVDALTQERTSLYDQLLRRQAEFENYRRRMERERGEMFHRARAEVLLELLPVLDNLERALSSVEGSNADPEAIRHGVELIHRQLKDAVTKFGLQPVEAVGQAFDPHLHEAVTLEPSDEHEENTVIEEFERGYKLGDKLLRPAKVKVASTP